MVHIKRVELSHFKSFGGTTQIPLLPGFTVVSGPNGSGKSNILDALLFCLGLASSKGMRAERLPDLVNHNQPRRGTIEASVTVTFDLSDLPPRSGDEWEQGSREVGEQESEEKSTTRPLANSKLKTQNSSLEWSVTRKLRVTPQGTYTSNYYINGESCNLSELHEQLNELRVYPEGYNVVLQGDVTGIISMNPRERREIIDELAGVAAFDRKITQAKQTLNEVKDREDSCRIVERELVAQRDRLSQDRIKAEKYQKLRAELQQKEQWEAVLKWRSLQQQVQHLTQQIEAGDRTARDVTAQISTHETEIQQVTTELDRLNTRVKALGEEELLALQSILANQEAERRQLQRQQKELATAGEETRRRLSETQGEIQQHSSTLEQLIQEQNVVETQELASLRQQRDEVQQALNQNREQASTIAASAEAWVQQQTTLNRQIETLLQTIDPQRTEQAQLRERRTNLERQIEKLSSQTQALEPEIAAKHAGLSELETELAATSQQVQALTESLAAAEQELQIQQETKTRLLQEQREKQRQMDKLEAQAQAQQEAQGTFATKVIIQSGLSGICGLVVQLGRVEPRYQLALETAAGGRLGNLVVEDDGVAAAGIELLKQKRAGRVTFLPLNRIQPPRFTPVVALRYANGFIDYAINLIECDPRYQDVFAYVFGNTIVFETLSDARRYLGQYRMVTLDGELLESSGAMTGGSTSQRSGLHFGTSDAGESAEAFGLKNRLQEIEAILERCGLAVNSLNAKTKQLSQAVSEAKANRRETQLHLEQLHKEINSLKTQWEQARSLLAKNTQELEELARRLQTLETELPTQEAQLHQYRQALAELEQSQTHSEWQQIQGMVRAKEAHLAEREQALRTAEQRLQSLKNQYQRLQEKIQECQERMREYNIQQQHQQEQLTGLNTQYATLSTQLAQTQASLAQLELKLGEEKRDRDRVEQKLREHHLGKQQLEWQLAKLQETQQERRAALTEAQTQLDIQQAELPDPLPDVPVLVASQASDEESASTSSQSIAFESYTAQLEQLQREMRSLQKRLQAMEPVNMLALEEYDRTQTRLQELSQKLATLEAERTELLLRIENFTTLRLRAFREAFDAVNQNFQRIFSELSDGDGYLQLDDAQDPFAGGLNLVAHPKGKPVQRLASMSGGEKSLTALSFIFALQRYRPSPFYAFDEVDMFLDGANVERLARMIRQQSKQAQFIVVSLRRPMMESSERTIGVTQARGAYTQVLGIKL